jgi:hypothetical protein
MTHNDLQDAARHQPFDPFRVLLTTGAVYDIRHPDLIMVGRRAAIIGVTNEPGGTAFERTIKVDLLHIVAIEELPNVPPSTNGAPS